MLELVVIWFPALPFPGSPATTTRESFIAINALRTFYKIGMYECECTCLDFALSKCVTFSIEKYNAALLYYMQDLLWRRRSKQKWRRSPITSSLYKISSPRTKNARTCRHLARTSLPRIPRYHSKRVLHRYCHTSDILQKGNARM